MLHVATVATESKYYLPYLQKTCAEWGVDLTILGMGEKWEGYIFKFKKIVDFLQSLPADDIVCFVDGYDVIVTNDLNELVPTFLKITEREQCKIIVAKDYALPFPFSEIMKLYFGNCDGQYINSGTYIGYVSNLSQILQTAILTFPNEKDDQKLIVNYCSLYPQDFYVDKDCELFQVFLCPFTEMKINNSPRPFFVHAAGCGYLTNILKDMGYEVDPEIKKNLRVYMIKKCSEHTIVFIKQFKFFFISIFVFILIFIILKKLRNNKTIKT